MYAISVACNLSKRTNKFHLQSVMKKLRNELTAFKICLAAFYIYVCTR